MVNGFMIFPGGSVSPPLWFGFSVVAVRFLRHCGSVSSPLRFGFSAVTDDIDDMDDNNE